MRIAAQIRLSVALFVAMFLASGCRYYKEQTGYLVMRAETFTHHYEGNPCGLFNKGRCDLDEVRFTLLHRGIKTVASCQSWDTANKCGHLQVGTAYKCSISEANQFGASLLSCEDHETLALESSEQVQ
jgi:hypothetical protein